MDQVPLADEETIEGVGEVAGDLLHPLAVRLVHDPADLYPPGCELHDEEDVVPRETEASPTSTRSRNNLPTDSDRSESVRRLTGDS